VVSNLQLFLSAWQRANARIRRVIGRNVPDPFVGPRFAVRRRSTENAVGCSLIDNRLIDN
jgi:hypothetical protein